MIPLYAWPTHREPLPLHVTGLTVDGEARDDLIDAGHERVCLDRVGHWQETTSVVTSVVPTNGTVAPPEAVYALVSSPRTQTRFPIPLTSADGDAWVGSVRMPRDIVAGVVALTVEATGTVDGRTRLLGRSDEWSLVVDAGEQLAAPGAAPFPMTWVRFDSTDAPLAARLTPDAPALMEMSGTPTLYLNDSIPGLQALLHADNARGERRRLRDLMGAEVARVAATTLVRAAVADVVINADGDGASVPADRMLRETLIAVAGHMRSPAGAEELCTRIARADGGPVGEHLALWAEIDAAVAKLCGSPEAVASAVKEARNG